MHKHCKSNLFNNFALFDTVMPLNIFFGRKLQNLFNCMSTKIDEVDMDVFKNSEHTKDNIPLLFGLNNK